MDFIRTAYTTKARLWQDDPTEVKIRWFRCEPDAVMVPQPNQYVSSIWDDSDDNINPPVGEVVGASKGYDKGANPLNYTGQTFFGEPSVWANGGTEGDEQCITDAQGSCPTCETTDLAATGGVGLGGTALFPDTFFGGVAWGGSLGNIDSYAGGVVWGGSLADIDSYAGGVVWGGSLGHIDSFKGGVEWGGVLPEIDTFRGGVEWGGHIASHDTFGGGVEWGGVIGPFQHFEGGVELGGSLGHIDSFEGGVELGGDIEHHDTFEGGVELGGVLGNIDPLEGGYSIGGDYTPEAPPPETLEGGPAFGGDLSYVDPPGIAFEGGVEMGGEITSSGPTQEAEYAGSGATDPVVGTIPWNNPGNIVGPPTGVYADVSLGPGIALSEGLEGSDYGFAVPSGATILGVKVTVHWAGSGGLGVWQWAQLVYGGSPIGTQKNPGTPIPGIPSDQATGGSTDLWGATLTDTIVNDPSFGVYIAVFNLSGGPEVVQAQSIQITVYYM